MGVGKETTTYAADVYGNVNVVPSLRLPRLWPSLKYSHSADEPRVAYINAQTLNFT